MIYLYIDTYMTHMCIYKYVSSFIYNYRRYSINHGEYVQSYTYTVSEMTNSEMP